MLSHRQKTNSSPNSPKAGIAEDRTMRDFIAVRSMLRLCPDIGYTHAFSQNPTFLPMPSAGQPSTNPVVEFPFLGHFSRQSTSPSDLPVVRTAKKPRFVQFEDES